MFTPLNIFGVASVNAIVLFVVIESGVVNTNTSTPQNNTVQQYSTPPIENKQNNDFLRLSKPTSLDSQLIKAGWKANAAHAVVALNNEWFTILKQDNPSALEKQLYLLKNLGRYSDLMPLFESHPETASLLAAATHPERFAQIVQNDDYYDIIMGLFIQHAAPDDAAALANALEIHSSLICRLIQRGLIGSQALFIFPRDNPGAQAYDRWLSELLDNALAQPDDKLSSVINLLFEQGESIRAKMIDDAQFRHAFRNDLWPKFIRVTHKTQQPFELYLSDPHLWAFLALPQGERLLEQWPWFLSQEQVNNLTPAAVLFGDEAYPEPLHPLIIEAILENDANTLISLLYFGHEPQFVRLMQRNLSDDLKQVVFSRLAQTPNYTALLEDWDKEPRNEQLYAELIEGDTGLLSTLDKVVQGREVSAGDAFWAMLDAADIAITIATLDTCALISSSLKLGAKTAAKSVLKQEIKKFVKQNAGQAVAKNASETLLASFAKKELFSKMQIIPSKLGEKNAHFDITPTLQFLFKKMNVNRTTLKRINNKWDARLFMRKDAKVSVQVDQKKLISGACLFFKITSATDVTGEAGVVAREVTCGLEQTGETIQMVKNSLKSFPQHQRQFKARQKNTSAWLLMNANP